MGALVYLHLLQQLPAQGLPLRLFQDLVHVMHLDFSPKPLRPFILIEQFAPQLFQIAGQRDK